ncbi:MAG: hypothetical protein H6568_06990 [Lewinellaceae bacterium]|nr:hypothetical protein [Lewinellaceae bacterium]
MRNLHYSTWLAALVLVALTTTSCLKETGCTRGFSGENCQVVDTLMLQYILDHGASPKELLDKGVSKSQLYGLYFKDGLIFFLDDNGYGLICDTIDLVGSAIWGCPGTDISDLPNALNLPTNPESEVGAKIGDGSSNTDRILSACGTEGIAAMICREKGSEWFLPSRGELHQMYLNLHLMGYGKFVEETYWSSSEYNNNSSWIQHFGIGHRSYYGKDYHHRVRPARSF